MHNLETLLRDLVAINSINPDLVPGAVGEAEIQQILQQQRLADPAFNAILRAGLSRAPLETPEDAAIVQAVSAAAVGVLGHPPELAGVAYWTDAATLWAAGIPSVTRSYP